MNSGSILLINPHQFSEKEIISRIWPPLSLANCASILRQRGFDVNIIDANAEKLSSDELKDRVRDYNADKIFVTSTPLDRWQCPYIDITPFVECVKIVNSVRDENSKIYVMGTHCTISPKRILDMTNADVVIIGEPEETVTELCEEKKIEDIDGICYKIGNGGNGVVVRRRNTFLNLDSLPIPSFDLLPMKKYFYELLGSDFTLMETSRGCPFDCIFCMKKMYGNKYRRKSVDKIRTEMEEAFGLGVKNVYFIDLELTVDKIFISKLCDLMDDMKKKGKEIRWCCQTRADTVDREILEKMYDAGCRLVHFGIETGSPRMLEVANKMTTLDKIEDSVNAAMDVGMDVACFFMFGLPTETEDDMNETIRFAKKLNPTYASFHVAIPYTGTKFDEMCGVDKNFSSDEKSFFPLCDPSRDYGKMRKVVRKAYMSYYARPGYIVNVFRKNPKLLLRQFSLFLRCVR